MKKTADKKTGKSEKKKQKPDVIHRAPTFEDVVSSLKMLGITSIRKRKFRLIGENDIPDHDLGYTSALEEANLKKPDFWVPVAHDGYAYQVYLCKPPWFKNDAYSLKWYELWKDHFKIGLTDEISDDPEYFVHSILEALTKINSEDYNSANSKKGGKMNKYETGMFNALRQKSYALLKQAMISACEYDRSTMKSPPALDRDSDTLPLSDQLAFMIEAAFRAGAHYERGCWYGRNIATIARQGLVMVNETKNQKGARKIWTKAAEELLIKNPKIMTRAIAKILDEADLISSSDDWEHVEIPIPGTYQCETKTFAAFSQAISRIRCRLEKI